MTDRTKDIFKDWKDKRNFYLEDGKTSEKFFDNLIKNALVYSYDKSRKETLEEVGKMIDKLKEDDVCENGTYKRKWIKISKDDLKQIFTCSNCAVIIITDVKYCKYCEKLRKDTLEELKEIIDKLAGDKLI